MSQNWTPFFFLQIWKVRAKEVKQDFLKVTGTADGTRHLLGTQLGLRWPQSPPRRLHPTSSFRTSLAFSLQMAWRWGTGEVFFGPLQGTATVGARRILFTAASFSQAADLDSRLDSSRMWSSGRCQIVITVRYNFLPPPLPLHQARGVHLFMEMVRSWPGIFR